MGSALMRDVEARQSEKAIEDGRVCAGDARGGRGGEIQALARAGSMEVALAEESS